MIAKVAIDLALDRLFDYDVPEALKEKLAVGQLLSVPFGHRFARGFVLELAETSDVPAERRKPVTDLVDETPFFSENLLTLVRKVSMYTAAPVESVLKAAVPSAVIRPNARPREQIYVEAVEGVEVKGLSKRAQWLYEQLVRLGGGWMSSLCGELKTTPQALRKLETAGVAAISAKARRRDPLAGRRILPSRPLQLNAEQSAALATITDGQTKPVLLFGVTGSGKTEVYLQAIAKELEAGRGAIVMVPEISLTPQTVQRFASRFGDRVAVLHSALSDGERYDEWHRIRSGKARVVVGPRSAVFAPVRDLGLIVVDEEHDTSYKQEELPRYNARDVAVLRGSIEGARVVLGSATPSLESWMNAKRGKYVLAEMKCRAGAGKLPYVAVVDMEEEVKRTGYASIFSMQLIDAIKLRLDRAEQTILFLNRRGFSRSIICGDCGHVVSCPECSIAYTYHLADDCCRCHLCGGWIPTPKKCPVCGSSALVYKGIGTQRAEEALKKIFPHAGILRMDADSTSRKNSHDDILGAFRRQEAQILLGTQMIAKGLDFPNVTLVGVLNADASLSMPDFRAAERTFQLLAQVSGRAGRAELPGEVYIQSYNPGEGSIAFAAKGDYSLFAEAELAERKSAYFPPYCHLATINLRSKDIKLVANWAEMYAKSLMRYSAKVKDFRVTDAMPSAVEKSDGWYRWQIVLRAINAGDLLKAWKWISTARPAPAELRIFFDMDAYNLM